VCPRCSGSAVHARGRLSCPECGYERVWRKYRRQLKRRAERLRCAGCGHQFTWDSWRENYRGEHLLSGNPVAFTEFVSKWPKCGSPEEQMIEVDSLLHAVHARGPLGPVLIEGAEAEVMALLDELAQQR